MADAQTVYRNVVVPNETGDGAGIIRMPEKSIPAGYETLLEGSDFKQPPQTTTFKRGRGPAIFADQEGARYTSNK